MTEIKYGKPKTGASSNVDTALLEKVTAIVNNNSKDLLIEFISNDLFPKLLSNWSYFSSINDHSHFVDISVKLSKLTSLINVTSGFYKTLDESELVFQLKIVELRPKIQKIYKDIFNNYLKVIYRALNNNKPSLTNPILRFLSHLINYDQSIAIEFLNTFDLSLSVLPKLLIPTKQELDTGSSKQLGKEHLSVRYNFIKFWIDLNSKLPHFHRKDLLTNNFKIMNNFWKHMIDADSLHTISTIIHFVDDKILQEMNFKRSSKCKILNENFMHKIQALFTRIDKKSDETLYTYYLQFLETLTCDSKYGIMFPNEKLWQSNITSGILINLNNKNFRIHNNLIYVFVTTLKPWEAFNQMLLLLKILQANPELVPVYMNWMIQHGGGYHDPSLTSWWIGHTLLYSNILQLPTPKFLNNDFVSIESNYNSRIILENIALAPISKSSLLKCLDCDKKILSQYALQLIMFTLKKLSSVLESNISCSKNEITSLVFSNLPDVSKIVEFYNKIITKYPQKSDMKLVKLTLLSIMKQYELIYPNSSSASQGLIKLSNAGIMDIIENVEASSDYDLALLDCFLSILSVQDKEQELKWWNSTGSTNSFFTCLIKLSTNQSIGASFSWKIQSLLSKLTANTLLFNESLIISPILALIQSFKHQKVDERVWKLLDEAISRASRTPYKYLDLSNQKYHNISLFVVVVFEQLKFVLKEGNYNSIMDWFFNFLQYLIVAGESKTALLSLLKDYLSEYSIEEYVSLLDFEKTNTKDQDESLTYLMINTSNKDLIAASSAVEKKLLTSKLDLASTLLRLKLIVNDVSITGSDSTIIDLASKISNYILSSESELTKFVFTRNFWNELLFSQEELSNLEVSSNRTLVCELLNELYKLIPSGVYEADNDLRNYINSAINNSMSLKVQNLVSNFIWILSDEQVKEAIENEKANEVVNLKLALLSLQRGISINTSFFHKLLALPKDDLKLQVVSQLIERNLVNFDNENLIDEVKIILSQKSNHNLIKSFINSNNPRRDDILFYLINEDIQDEVLLCYIAYSICLIDNCVDDKIDAFLQRSFNVAFKLLVSAEEQVEWKQLLVILARGIRFADDETKSSVLDHVLGYVDNYGDKFGFVAEFAALMYELIEISNKKVSSWIHKSMLYITKMYAEASEISESFDFFLEKIQMIIMKIQPSQPIWKSIPAAILNTQLEVFLNHKKWIKNEKYLTFANILVLAAFSNTIQYEKLLQIFVNNDMNSLLDLPSNSNGKSRFLSSLIIYNLFNLNHSKCSTPLLLDQLLVLYLGSIRTEDVLLKSILVKIESKISKSWITKVRNWEFSEELKNEEFLLVGEPRLITKDKSNFVVSLSKNYINNSITYGNGYAHIPDKKGTMEQVWNKFEKMYRDSEVSISPSYENTVYDAEFFLLLILNNEELIKLDKPGEEGTKAKFDVVQFINSGILQYIIANVGNTNENVRIIAKILLQGILQTLETIENFKDANIFKVYISNILFTLRSNDIEIPGLVWYMYSGFANILGNPGHFLYEKTFRYILSTPQIKANDIPIATSIILAIDLQVEEDSYYKQVPWLIEQLTLGLHSQSDLNLIKNKGIIEWIMNLMNSPFITMKIKTLIFKFLERVELVDQGSDLLVTRFGVVSNLEQQKQKHSSNDSLIDSQINLNIDQIMIRLGISVASSKRINQWTEGDLPNVVKRVCTKTKE